MPQQLYAITIETYSMDYSLADHYHEKQFQKEGELIRPTKYCCGCGRWLYPDEKWFYATSSRNVCGKTKYTKRLICKECKEEGVGF